MFALTLIGALAIQAQSRVEFEVASVKPSKSGSGGVRGGCHGIDSIYRGPGELIDAAPLGRCVFTDARLSHLIGRAYDLRSMQLIKGGPDWVTTGDTRFNIEAEADDPTKATEAQLLQMLQALLEDRFKLKFHRETVDKPGFAMVVARNGPKLQAAKGDEITTSFGAGRVKPVPGQPTALTARKYTMPMLANMLSQIGPGPVSDQTGLNGAYDFQLTWDETAGPSLFTALREQLGLRLESRKVPVSLFVIDSAEKPIGN